METAAINRPDRAPKQLSEAEAAEAHKTHYIKDGNTLLALMTACARPDVLMRGLAAIVKLRNLRLRQRGYWLFSLAEA